MGELSSENPFDLLTDDFFIIEILSRFYTLNSIVRLSLVSKKLHTLCYYAPVIEFGEITDAIINYLNDLFSFRMNSNIKSEFRRFRFCMQDTMYVPTFKEHLLRWFQDALSLNVQELILMFKEEAVPYHYGDIPSLKLHCYHPLKHLRVLKLHNIPIGLNESFEDWVSTCCVSLEELHLQGVFVFPSKLRIESLSLRVFNIYAHFRHLHISAPKLTTLHVVWDLVYLGRREPNLSLRVSSAPNLEDFALANWDTPISVEYFCSDDKRNFASPKVASLLFPRIANLPLDSFKRLLLYVSRTGSLLVTETILHKISHHGIIHLATSFDKLEKLNVVVSDKSRWTEQTDTVMSFVKKLPSLKTFILTTCDGDRRNNDSQTFKESLDDNIFKFGISRAAVYLDDNRVKVELSPGEDETLLVQHIIKDAPRGYKFFFSYPH